MTPAIAVGREYWLPVDQQSTARHATQIMSVVTNVMTIHAEAIAFHRMRSLARLQVLLRSGGPVAC